MAIEAKLTVNNEEFKKGLKDAENQASNSMKKISSTSADASSSMGKIANAAKNAADVAKGGMGAVTGILSKMGPYGIAAAAAITLIGGAVAGVIKGIGALTSHLDSVAKSAKSVNMTANAYLSLQHACNRAGLEMQSVLGIINKIDYALNHSADGEKKYRDAFYSIGLSWRDLENMSPEKRLMAINDALSKLKSQGKNMPTEMFNVFGRKDMETLNKMTSEKGFNKFIAEAGALGYTVPQSMIDAAESYQDALGDTKDKLKSMVASMEDIETITKGLTNMWNKLSSIIGKSNGFVPKEYSDQFIGIGDATKDLLTNGRDKLSEREMREIVLNKYRNLLPMAETSQNSKALNASMYMEYERFISSLSGEDLIKEFDAQIKNIDWDEIGDIFKHQLYKILEVNDTRFKENDQSTWVQARRKTPEDNVKQNNRLINSKALDEADYLNKQLVDAQEYYDNISIKKGKLVNVDKEIELIENRLKKALGDQNAELDKEVKHQLKMNAALANAKALQNEIARLNEQGNKSYSAFYADMLGQMGASKQMVEQLFASFEQMGSSDRRSGLISSLNLQYLKNTNPKKDAESIEEYYQRIQELLANSENMLFKKPEDFLEIDPEGFFKAFKGIAQDFEDNNIFAVAVGRQKDDIAKAVAEYNKFAEKNKLKPIEIEIGKYDTATNAKNFDIVSDKIEEMKDFTDKEKQRLNELESRYNDLQQTINDLKTKRAKLLKDLDKASGKDKDNIANEISGINLKLNDINKNEDNIKLIKEYETSIRGIIKKRDELQEKLNKLNQDSPTGESARKAMLGKQIGDLDDKIRAIQKEKDDLDETMAKAQKIFGNAKLIEEFKKNNKEANFQQVVNIKWKFRQDNSDIQNEADILNAEIAGNNDLVDSLRQQAILKKAGIEPTEKNLKLYKDELDATIKLNKELDAAKNKKTLNDKAKDSEADNAMTKATLNKDYNVVSQLERENVLRSIGVDITKENLALYSAYIDRIIQAQREQKKLNLASQMTSDAKSATYTGLEKIGRGEEAAVLKAFDNAQSTLGRNLSTEEGRLVKELAELQYKISNWTMPQQQDDVVQTNDLARRGGFNSSVVVEKNDNSRQILKSVMTMQQLLTTSNTLQDQIRRSLIN